MNTTQWYIGRNVKSDNDGYYLVIGTADITKRSEMGNAKRTGSVTTYRKAKAMMDALKDGGAYWFDAHFDPTI